MARVLSRVGVLIGLESVPGVYEAPTQVVKVENVITPNVEMDNVEIPNFGFLGGTKDSVTIADWGRMNIEITTSLYKSLSYYSNLFEISNLKKTPLENDAGFEFTPETHKAATGSIDLVLPDRRFKAQGAKSSFQMSGTVGDKVNVTFGVQAAFLERVIAPQTLVDVPGDELMIIRRLGSMTLNGVQINLSEFSFDMGNVINYEKFTNVGEFHLADYEPKLTVKMRLEDGGSDGFDELIAGSTMDFVAEFRDSNGNTVWKLEIPKAKLSTQPTFEDSEGIFVIQREFNALSNLGDDNFTLTYYTPGA